MIRVRDFMTTLDKIAPLHLAGSWDNVGVLISPTDGQEAVTGVCMTIDLRESVLDEAIAAGANVILTYHPILFGGAKQLRLHRYADRVILRAIQHQISIYSPHTALDAVSGGVTDWLLNCVGDMRTSSIIEPNEADASHGMGRVGTLSQPRALTAIIDRLKQELGLPYLRLATANNAPLDTITINRVAVCPGAGGSVVAGAKGHDLVVTGEMRHHDVLSLQSRGVSTILTEHTNCERGYLPQLAAQIKLHHEELPVHIACTDRDPLFTV